jgi:DNA-nicking Smr family endonuclease
MARKPPRPGKRKKSGVPGDVHLWHAVGETVDPLTRRKSADPRAALLKALETPAEDLGSGVKSVPSFAAAPMPSKGPVIAASKIPASQKPIEPNLKRRVMRGREPIDATLDLHGMTQIRAQAALEDFVQHRAARGDRTLLVITGKGIKKTGYLQLEQKGVLREMVPLWLNAPGIAPLVAGIEPAHQSHGGGGALYVRLKRRREA